MARELAGTPTIKATVDRALDELIALRRRLALLEDLRDPEVFDFGENPDERPSLGMAVTEPVVADTSVLTRLQRPAIDTEVSPAIVGGLIHTCAMVRLEVMRGFQSRTRWQIALDNLPRASRTSDHRRNVDAAPRKCKVPSWRAATTPR